MPQINDSDDPAVAFSDCKKGVCHHPVFIYRFGIGIPRYRRQPFLITFGFIK